MAVLIAGLLAIGVLAASCGDDSDSGASAGTTAANSDGSSADAGTDEQSDADSDEAPTITKAAYLKQADAICSEAERNVKKEFFDGMRELAKEAEYNPKEAEVSLIESLLIPTVRTELEELRALGYPSGDEERVEAIYAAVEEVLAEAEVDPTKISNTSFPYRKPEKLADDYGLTACPFR